MEIDLSLIKSTLFSNHRFQAYTMYLCIFRYKWEIPFTFTTNTSLNFNQTDADIIWMGRNGSEGKHNVK